MASNGSVEQTMLAGIEKLTTVRIPTLSIGSVQAADVPVLVQDLSDLCNTLIGDVPAQYPREARLGDIGGASPPCRIREAVCRC